VTLEASTRAELLDQLVRIAHGLGVAEDERGDPATFFKNFLPLPDHARALDPDIFLILGGRGAGKTALFLLLDFPQGLEALSGERQLSLPFSASETIWVPAFGRTHTDFRDFPTPEVQLDPGDRVKLRAYWLGLAVGRLLNRLDRRAPGSEWAAVLGQQDRDCLRETSRVSQWLPLAVKRLEDVNYSLDTLDRLLAQRRQWLFLTYDELDRLVPSYLDLGPPIRELLALWLDRWRRWERIRPKIFLRNDLFREEFLAFPDASKLRGHKVELTWQTVSLYRLVAKRMANAGQELKRYLERQVDRLRLRETPPLGLLPDADEAGFRQLMDVLVGTYMGADKRKGITYNWIPNHLQDGTGKIAPRSFLKLFSLAAERSRTKAADLKGTALLQPTDLQGALMETSNDRIRELQEEYPWIEALRGSLRGLEVPAWPKDFRARLSKTQWSTQAQRALQDTSPQTVLELLRNIGVVTVRTDGRLNVPEIYLHGFGLKRKGGIKRPR
jgi:hypothetical protein